MLLEFAQVNVRLASQFLLNVAKHPDFLVQGVLKLRPLKICYKLRFSDIYLTVVPVIQALILHSEGDLLKRLYLSQSLQLTERRVVHNLKKPNNKELKIKTN